MAYLSVESRVPLIMNQAHPEGRSCERRTIR